MDNIKTVADMNEIQNEGSTGYTGLQRLRQFIICLLIPLVVGFVSYLIARDGMNLFDTMDKPPLSPPAWLFSVAWTILYILMGIGSFAVYASDRKGRASILFIYGVSLFFNFLWSPVFFIGKLYWFALVWLVIMMIMVVVMTVRSVKVSKLAVVCFAPYIVWCLFAVYLNTGIAIMN